MSYRSSITEINSKTTHEISIGVSDLDLIDRNRSRHGILNIYIDDTSNISVTEIRSKCRRLKLEKNLGLVIVDYLQLMNASGASFGSRQEEVSTISRSLKGLAKELDIPIIALSQLNRGVESREGIDGKRPQLSDLRESGAIEQDADMVIFIHRYDYQGLSDNPDDIGRTQIIIAKHRNGAIADVDMRFRADEVRFVDEQESLVNQADMMSVGSAMNDDYPGPMPPSDFGMPDEFA